MSNEVSICIHDAANPDIEVLQFRSNAIPRKGDKVHFKVTSPSMAERRLCTTAGELIAISGEVVGVAYSYQEYRTRYSQGNITASVTVLLMDCEMTFAIEEGASE